jgi:hypothetical protein
VLTDTVQVVTQVAILVFVVAMVSLYILRRERARQRMIALPAG